MSVQTDVTPAEAFRAAADEAKKALIAGISDGAAPTPESGSSPAEGAESNVPAATTEVVDGASKKEETPAVKTEGVVIDQEAAWNEYKNDEERKKALVHNKVHAAEGWKKARELEAQLAEANKAKETKSDVVTEPVVEAPEPDYDEWVGKALKEPDTKEKTQLAQLANEYNQHLAEVLTPAETQAKELDAKVRDAAKALNDAEVAMKYLQSRKDTSLYETDIAEAKELLTNARFELQEAKIAARDARDAHREAEQERLTKLGSLRKEARTVYDTEVSTRRDSASARKAQEESVRHQKTVDQAWETAKSEAIKSRGDLDEETKQLLLNAADGAIVRAASNNEVVPMESYATLIEKTWKPFGNSAEKIRQDAVKTALDVAAEPTPSQASAAKNVDAQPKDYNEWKARARAHLKAS